MNMQPAMKGKRLPRWQSAYEPACQAGDRV